ncbi:MAG TPA: DUF3488 and DUF4129 domain-containing transglutaminase family protein [Candidatus Methylacidiphilales bacterium]|nr:DUF3488 and DUF4129 domain-containing transglutaminase family protein [Candidatus Methylacidiphilales bacterium]
MGLGFFPFLRPAHPAPPLPRPSRTLFFWLMGSFVLTLLPQADVLPAWVSAVIIGALVIRAVLEIYRLPLPSTLFTALLALCLLVAVGLQFQSIFSREAETAFMAGLMAIKFYELRSPRDASMIIFASFFVVMSALLYSEALELFIYCLIMMWVLTAILLRNSMGDREEHHLLPMLGQAGIIFLQALPLAFFLFFFFPRYTGKLQITLNEAPLGISDIVKPGSVAGLAKNDDEAMYVHFDGSAPTPEMMYWRGLVLWDYKEGAWTPGNMGAVSGNQPPEADRDSISFAQDITILPHNQRWLFALDYPTSAAFNSETGFWTNSKSSVLSGEVLQVPPGDGFIDHRERYRVTSASQLAPIAQPRQSEIGAALQLPDKNDDRIDPQVIALADRLHAANPTPEAYAMAVLRYFRQEHFIYTASPGTTPPGRDWLSYFLFTTKAGYCEHFASAFGVLMRQEGVPARLVVGYVGADYNPYADIYTVKQSNAHAWDEIWLATKGRWIRIDPTAILPPGLANFASAPNSRGADDNKPLQMVSRPLSFLETYLPPWANRALTEFAMRREQIEVGWDDWVFSYTPDSQIRLAHALGGRDALAVICLAATALCAFILRRFMRRRAAVPPIENLYAKFCRSMAQRGIPRATWEGPLAYTDRVAEALPDQKEAIHHVGQIVAHSRYAPFPSESHAPKELQTLLDEIAPGRPPAPAIHE